MITVKHLRVRTKNSKWQKPAKKKKRGKQPRTWKLNTLLSPKRTNQLQKHQSQNHSQQVCCSSWNQISFFSLFFFTWLWFILVWRRASLSASSFHTCEKSPNSQTCTEKTRPVLRCLHTQTSVLPEPGSWQGAQVDSTRSVASQWHQPINFF